MSTTANASGNIRFLNPPAVEVQKKKYCRFENMGINYIDSKDATFLTKFVNEQGKLLPRRLTGTSLKFQRKVGQAVKRARHIALMPYVTDLLK
ncbi:MAG: 30S ribosomal protein S18 [Bacteroidetes bacterium]|nr:30S ribosomal protein S18 [Bacteroidota bacterium]